ncbi:MAG TPA: hypothetical protein VHA14_03390 [Bryobacteraceae bacterium]|nr:hypothetical protein [Bryobacteraceae bacterium]
MRLPDRSVLFPLAVVIAIVTAVYGNHFHNGFHFDDFHAVTTNPYIRDLRNIPLIFRDADTFSTLPANRGWRPLVTSSLAVDYAIARGLRPGYFQASDFFWFAVQLCLMFPLFRHILDFARPAPVNRWIALFATALYGVHPVMAETVNYIIQRGDIYSTLGVVAGLLLYIRWPHRRNQGLYLIPVLLGLLSKPPALVFPAILFTYLMLFEDAKPLRALARSMPALLLAAGMGVLSSAMTPKSYDPGAWPAFDYRITQFLVTLRYFRSFFLPLWLSADTDHVAEASIFHGYVWAGFLFVMALLALAVWCSRRQVLRPIAFGIYWYFLALLPTSLFALAEVENDHRMYFPYVGLVLSVVYAAALLLRPENSRPRLIASSVLGVLILAVAGYGTTRRNAVWYDEESLWYDVTLKSPTNGRGLMNYGLTQMEKGDYVRALSYFTRAETYTPDYYVLEINLGIANGALNNDAEAERHFARSLELAPQDAQALYFYAVWLRQKDRYNEAIQALESDIQYNPAYLDARYLLMHIYHDLGDNANLDRVARELLAEFPSDEVAQTWLRGQVPPE